MNDDKILAIIKNVGFGMRDASSPVLWFDAYESEGTASLQCIPATAAISLIKKHGIRNVADLEGRPCWVLHENGLVHFIDFWEK